MSGLKLLPGWLRERIGWHTLGLIASLVIIGVAVTVLYEMLRNIRPAEVLDALTDTDPDMGGFQCIPETYQNLAEFLKTQTQEQIASRNPDYAGYSITRPRLAAGDLLIWTSLLLHRNGHNTSNRVRL